jgi:MSHA biogenesis protein MshQ
MDQPFEDVTFEVTAYSAHGSTATNYGLFDTNLKASFELTGDYHERLNIAPSDLDNTHWSNATWETPNLSNSVIWSRKSASMLASNVTTTTTTADGPFNEGVNSITTGLNLAISGTDPVSFDKNQTVVDQELLSQPDVRYGRMVLDSVGAAVGQSVMIPLRVEYWNGTGFVISDSDNATTFNGANYCKQTIWPDPSSSSNSALSGSNLSGIDSGIDRRNLKAIADTNNATLREQVRFWLRLASISPQVGKANVDCSEEPSSSQPWLQYNWRGKGDEDPSTVVTFGIYRGNDRIIFRGESNIIGTSN